MNVGDGQKRNVLLSMFEWETHKKKKKTKHLVANVCPEEKGDVKNFICGKSRCDRKGNDVCVIR